MDSKDNNNNNNVTATTTTTTTTSRLSISASSSLPPSSVSSSSSSISLSILSVDGYIRVYFVDGAWTTIPCAFDFSSWQLCEIIAKKRNLTLAPISSTVIANLTQSNVNFNVNPGSHITNQLINQANISNLFHNNENKSNNTTNNNTSNISNPTIHPVNTNNPSFLHIPLAPTPGIEIYGLYLSLNSTEEIVERRLEDDEKPLQIQESLRKQGLLDNLKFYFKKDDETEQSEAQSPNNHNSNNIPNLISTNSELELDTDTNSGLENEIELNKRLQRIKKAYNAHMVGYLEKRGKTNTAWKERWFVLQYDKLHYFKSHQHTTAISYIAISEATIKPVPLAFAQTIADDPNSTNKNSVINPQFFNQSTVVHSNAKYMFEINTQQRIFYLRAKTYRDMVQWIKQLKKHTKIERANEYLDTIQLIIDEQAEKRAEQDEMRAGKLLKRDLNYLLEDRIGLRCLLAFCVENHCEENLLFWLDAAEYRLQTARSEPDTFQRAMQIYETYIRTGAVHEIHTQPQARDLIFNAIQADTNRTAFVQLQQSTFALIQSGVYSQFLDSKAFQQCLIGMNPTNETNPKLFLNNLYAKWLHQRFERELLKQDSLQDQFINENEHGNSHANNHKSDINNNHNTIANNNSNNSNNGNNSNNSKNNNNNNNNNNEPHPHVPPPIITSVGSPLNTYTSSTLSALLFSPPAAIDERKLINPIQRRNSDAGIAVDPIVKQHQTSNKQIEKYVNSRLASNNDSTVSSSQQPQLNKQSSYDNGYNTQTGKTPELTNNPINNGGGAAGISTGARSNLAIGGIGAGLAKVNGVVQVISTNNNNNNNNNGRDRSATLAQIE